MRREKKFFHFFRDTANFMNEVGYKNPSWEFFDQFHDNL